MRSTIVAILSCLFIFSVFFAGSCSSSGGQQARQTAVAQRNNTFSKASSVVPVPQLTNFPGRKALADYTSRQDLIDHPWYVYILGDQGNTIGYYVAKTYPLSTCDFLSSTQDVQNSSNGNLVLDAPSLDGIFYGGSGSSAQCGFFMFDAATNALIVLSPGVHFYTADQPLALNAQPIKVSPK